MDHPAPNRTYPVTGSAEWTGSRMAPQLLGDGAMVRTIAAFKPVGDEICNLRDNAPHSRLTMIEKIEQLVRRKSVIDSLSVSTFDTNATRQWHQERFLVGEVS